jgi:transglutaminase-like putative cysteine protease
MSWRIGVRHCTGYRYGRPARASYNEARMTPMTGGGQHRLESRIEVVPPVRPLRYRDYWGTVVDAFDVHLPHTEMVVTATAVVETTDGRPVPADEPSWAALTEPALQDRFAELLAPSRYVVFEDEVTAVASALAGAQSPVAAGRAAATWAHEALTYGRGSTTVHSTSAEARAMGTGVCQDYTHVALAVLRAMGLPARYVSGYLHPKPDAGIGQPVTGESHAWVEWWDGGWNAFDPTNSVEIGTRHVTLGRGRDYGDVPPFKGLFSGPKSEGHTVTVEVTRLA